MNAEEDLKTFKNRTLSLHASEVRLIESLRGIEYGEMKIKVQDGLPVYCTEIQRNRKLI